MNLAALSWERTSSLGRGTAARCRGRHARARQPWLAWLPSGGRCGGGGGGGGDPGRCFRIAPGRSRGVAGEGWADACWARDPSQPREARCRAEPLTRRRRCERSQPPSAAVTGPGRSRGTSKSPADPGPAPGGLPLRRPGTLTSSGADPIERARRAPPPSPAAPPGSAASPAPALPPSRAPARTRAP